MADNAQADYDSIIQNDLANKAATIRDNLTAAQTVAPAQAAQTLNLSQQTGIPPDTTSRNLPAVQQQAAMQNNYDDMVKNYPILSDVLQDKHVAAAAQNDVPILQRLETTFANAPTALTLSQDQVTIAHLSNKWMDGTITPQENAQLDKLRAINQVVSKNGPLDSGDWWSKGIIGASQLLPQLADQSVPAMAGAVGVGGATQVAATFIPPLEPAVVPMTRLGYGMGSYVGGRDQVSGQVVDLLRDITGPNGEKLTPEQIGHISTLSGIGGGMLSTLPLHAISKMLPSAGGSLVDQVSQFLTKEGVQKVLNNPEMAQTLADIGKNYAAHVAEGTVGMGAITGVTTAADQTGKAEVGAQLNTGEQNVQDVGKSLEDAFYTMLVAGAPGAAFSTGKYALAALDNNQPHPLDVKNYADQAGQLSAQSELRQNSPATFRGVVNRNTDGANFFLPPDVATKLYQNMDEGARAQLNNAVPDFQNDLAEAVTTGADMKIPQADWFTYLSPNGGDAVTGHLKMDPSQYSMEDIRERQYYEDMLDPQGMTEDEVVHRRTAEQAMNAGHTPEAANVIADLVTNRYTSAMDRYGDNAQAQDLVQKMTDNLFMNRELAPETAAAVNDGHVDDLINRTRDFVSSGGGGEKQKKYPILGFIKEKGGVRPGTPLADDLKSMGITNKTLPGLINGKDLSKFGLDKGIDNIPAETFQSRFGTVHSEEGDNGYVNQPWLMDKIDDEVKGKLLQPRELSPEESFANDLDKIGVDLHTQSNAEIKEAIKDYMSQYARGDKVLAQTERTSAGDQHIIPGTEPLAKEDMDKRTVEQKTAAPLAPKKPQNPLDIGLFSNDKDQKTLFQRDMLRQDDKAVTRGYFQMEGEHRATITLTKHANLTTTIHELAHWFSAMQAKLATVDERAASDWDAMKKYLGAEGQDELTTEQEEKLARSFEAYTAEGKAPSVELQGAFQRMKSWMVSAYKIYLKATGGGTVANAVGVKLDDGVRNFFDRMLATDDQIEQLRQKSGFDLNEDVLNILPKADQERYKKLAEKEIEQEKDRLLAKALRQSHRENKKAYKDAKAASTREATKQVYHSPLYRAINFLKKGEVYKGDDFVAPEPFKLDRKGTEKSYGKDVADKLPDGVFGKDGVHPDAAAETFGYDTGKEFVDAMSRAQNPKDVINGIVEKEMLERYGDMMKDGSIEREALEVAHNDYRAQRLEMEGKVAAEKAGIPFPPGTNFKIAAAKIMGDKNIIDAGIFNRFYLAGMKAAREYGKELKAGNYFKAAEWKQRQLLNHHMYREGLAAKKLVDSTLNKWKRLRTADDKITKRIGADYLYAARSILSRYGVMNFKQDVSRYIENLRNYDPQGYEDIRPALEENTVDAKPWKSLSLDEFKTLRDNVDNIIGVGRGANQITIEGKKVAKDEIVAGLAERFQEIKGSGLEEARGTDRTKIENIKENLYTARAMGMITESWVKMMDGGFGGKFRDVFINPIFEAKDQYNVKRLELLGKLNDLITPHEDRLTGERIPAPEINLRGGFKNKGELLGMMLHLGNDSNKDKLLRGYKWRESDFDSMMERMENDGTITKDDWDLAQSLWKLTDSMKPDAWRAFKRMYGYYPQEVTADPFETKFGSYEGGYWPAIVDRKINEDAAVKGEKDNIVAYNSASVYPSTTLGPTKARNDSYAGPLSLDLNLLPSHIDKMLRITYLQPAVKDAAKIVFDRNFRAELHRIDPSAAQAMLVPWLQRTANQIIEMPSTSKGWRLLDSGARWLRSTTTGQIIMYNLPSGMRHITGLSVAAHAVGAARIGEQVALHIKDPKGYAESIFEKSPFMRFKNSSFTRELQNGIDDILKGSSTFQRTKEAMDKQGGLFFHIFRGYTDNITWGAAYDKAIADGKDEMNAVRFADFTVRDTQGNATPESMATYQVGSAFAHLFTMYSTFFNSQTNYVGSEAANILKDYGARGGSKKLFMLHLMAITIPAIGSRLIYDSLKGAPPSNSDPNGPMLPKWLMWFAGAEANYVSGMVPYAGQGINAIWNRYVEHRGAVDDGIFSSPIASASAKVAAAPGEVVKAFQGQSDPGHALMDSMAALGFATGLPLGQIGKPAGYLLDVATHHAHPVNFFDFGRGLIAGPRKQQ